METKTETKFGVARGETLIHPALFSDVLAAKNQMRVLNGQMESLGLEPDIQLVDIVVKTTYGRPHPHKEPADEVAPVAEVTDVESGADGDSK